MFNFQNLILIILLSLFDFVFLFRIHNKLVCNLKIIFI